MVIQGQTSDLEPVKIGYMSRLERENALLGRVQSLNFSVISSLLLTEFVQKNSSHFPKYAAASFASSLISDVTKGGLIRCFILTNSVLFRDDYFALFHYFIQTDKVNIQ